MDLGDYISNWINKTVSLNEWFRNEKVDHWDFIDDEDLDDDEIEEIEQHQFQLFNQFVNRVVKGKVRKLNSLDPTARLTVVNEHLRIINLFLNSTEINEIIMTLLSPIITITEKHYVPVLADYQQILHHKYNYFRVDFDINNSPYYKASVLYKYQKELNALLHPVANDQAQKSQFSVLEWATIFYYADETKLSSNEPHKIDRMKDFMSQHNMKTTLNNFKTKYYHAVERINKTNNYPTKKLQSLIPFLEENYHQTVPKIKNDILYLEENTEN